MKKVLRISLFIVLVAAVGGWAGWAFLRKPEPIYAGKPLHFWIKLLDDTSPGFDPSPPWQTLDTNTVPVLIAALEHCDSFMPKAYADFHARTWRFIPRPILARMPHPEDLQDIGINSLLLLEARPSEAKLAIPTVIHIVRTDGSRTLKSMVSLRRQAVAFLGFRGEDNQAVTATLLGALKDPDPYVRYHAAQGLNRVAPDLAKKVLKPADLEPPH